MNVKEAVKIGCGVMALGFTAAVVCCRKKEHPRTCEEVMVACAELAIVLTAFTTTPGQQMVGWLLRKGFWMRWVPTYSIFAQQPLHPRHVFSLLSFGLTFPLLIYSLWKKKLPQENYFRSIFIANLLILLSHRTTLHLGNLGTVKK